MAQTAGKGSLRRRAASVEAVQYLHQAIGSGKHWYHALLETIGLWTVPEETYKGRRYRYLISGEAFDWLTLAERLCLETNGLIPESERDSLLLHGQAPVSVAAQQLRAFIGPSKYKAFLNYFYGVVVEEALQAAVEEELQKESYSRGYLHDRRCHERMFELIYGEPWQSLLEQFRKEKRWRRRSMWTYLETREFTYWLFKRRLRQCDKARVASDTKKGLEWLHRQWSTRNAPHRTLILLPLYWDSLSADFSSG